MEDTDEAMSRVAAYAALILACFSLEVFLANAGGRRIIPFDSLYFWPAALVLLLLVVAVVLADRQLLGRFQRGRLIWYELTAGMMLYGAAQHQLLAEPWPWVFLGGLVLAFRLPFPAGRTEGPGLFLIVAALNLPGLNLVLERLIEGSSTLSLLRLGLPLLFPALAAAFLRWFDASFVPVSTRRRWGLAAAAALLVMTGGHWFLAEPSDGFQPEFTGRVPEFDARRPRESLPNLIVISLDTLRWDMVPPRAPAELALPTLKKLRRDSLVFENAFAPTSTTPHTHGSLFSGLPPTRTGTFRDFRIHESVWLYPQVLKKIGYRTGGFTGGGFVRKELGFSRGYDRYWEYPRPYEAVLPGGFLWLEHFVSPGEPLSFEHHIERGLSNRPLRIFDSTVSRSLDWLDRGDQNRPFYLFLHTYQIHDFHRLYPHAVNRLREQHPRLLDLPMMSAMLSEASFSLSRWLQGNFSRVVERLEGNAGRKYREVYEALSSRRKRTVRLLADSRRVNNLLDDSAASRPEGEALRRRLEGFLSIYLMIHKKLYQYNTELTDRHLGRLVEGLRERELYDDTTIVVLSDHGEGFLLDSTALGHGAWGEEVQLQDVLVRVPLWVKLPDQRSRGRSVEKLFPLADLFPFLLRHIGDPVDVSGPGAPRPDPNSTTLHDTPARNVVEGAMPADGVEKLKSYVRSRDYKLETEHEDDEKKWFSVQRRGFAQSPVEASTIPAEIRSSLEPRADWIYSEHRKILQDRQDDTRALDPGLKQELRGLGYLR